MTSSLRVLIVEQNLLRQRLQAQSIKQLKHHVKCVNTAWDAIDQCFDNRYDVIVMNNELSDMGGEDLVKRLRTVERESGVEDHSAFIAVVCHETDDATTTRILAAGASEVYTSPVSMEPMLNFASNWVLVRDAVADWVLV